MGCESKLTPFTVFTSIHLVRGNIFYIYNMSRGWMVETKEKTMGKTKLTNNAVKKK